MTNESATPAALPVVHSAGDATALSEGPPQASGYGARPDAKDQSPRPEPLAVSEGELPARPTVDAIKKAAEKRLVRFVSRSYGQCSMDTMSLDTLCDIVREFAAPQGQPAPDLAGVLEALERVRLSLHQANKAGEIVETLWAGPAETTFDALDGAIEGLRAIEGGKTQ